MVAAQVAAHAIGKLAAAGFDPDELRPYAQNILLHPFLDKTLQDAGIAEAFARFKTIKALSGSPACASPAL